ncbi:LysR family transcriptional regulator [Nocardia panacis]|uniref:LysR family transcriptional regulator n=1 Tax=Nocardia panacis TaxID=2340916 RepID=A0A3A4KFK9_9NOCA|nr:LysR family transcriptional regulator [Nocardia panacis]RJO72126.1 LysR family transcriptional regulator [Nocardia panacis]
MERYEIEAFLTVAEELHFGRAAERLAVSTGRISQTIQRLERRVGAKLFDRTSRRVELTPIGRQLLEDLRPGHERVLWAVERATAAGRGIEGVLSVGFVGAAAGQFVLATTEAFRREHPGAEVRIREVQIADGLAGSRADAYDMALFSGPLREPDLVTGPTVLSERRMLAVRATHPLATEPALTLEDLSRVTLLRMPHAVPESIQADRTPAHTPSGIPIAHGPVANTFQEMLALIGAGVGAFICGEQVTKYYRRPDVVYLPITDGPPIEWYFVWHRSRQTARILAFNDMAVRVARGRTG